MKVLNDPKDFVYQTPYPGLLMEEYIGSGAYKILKQLTVEKNILHKYIQNLLIDYERKRIEIGHNLVAKFVPKKIYEYDYPGLNEYLYDHGLLQELTNLTTASLKANKNILKILEPYQLKTEFFLKTALNKHGRELTKAENPLIMPVSLENAAMRKRENLFRLRTAQSKYNDLKQLIEKTEEFERQSKITYKYGTITRIQKPTHYNVKKMMDPTAIQTLIELGKPNISQFNGFFLRGIISPSEVESFRTLKDIQLVFIILDLKEEAAILSRLQK